MMLNPPLRSHLRFCGKNNMCSKQLNEFASIDQTTYFLMLICDDLFMLTSKRKHVWRQRTGCPITSRFKLYVHCRGSAVNILMLIDR
jgi:hypothetical protein